MNASPRDFVPVFSLRGLLGLVLVAALLSSFISYSANHQRAYRRARHINNLKQLSLALLNYEGAFRDFPPTAYTDSAGQPICSWRALILPFYESSRDRFNFQSPWNAPANAKLGGVYRVAFAWDETAEPNEALNTNVLGIAGPGALFDDSRRSLLEFGEGSRDLIVLIEVRNSGIHWMQPGDLDYRELVELERNGKLRLGVMDDGFCVLFLDGRAWRLRADTPRDLLLKFMTVEGAKANDAEELLGPYRMQ